MVKVNVDGQEFYMDAIEKENLDLIKDKIKDDWDMCFVFGGPEGTGKSTKAFQLAYYCSGSRFTLDHVCFTPQDFEEKIKRPNFLKQGDSLVLDEGFIINSRASMTEVNRTFLGVLSECRQKNLFLFIICPNYFDLDKNLALWRSRGLFYIYHDKMNRGYFKFYNYDRKKALYIKGKKFFNYNAVKPNFRGRFSKFMPFSNEDYKKKKLNAFEFRIHSPVKEKHMRQRNILFQFCIELGASQRDIANYLTAKGEKMSQQGVSKGLLLLTTDNNNTINLKKDGEHSDIEGLANMKNGSYENDVILHTEGDPYCECNRCLENKEEVSE